MRGRSYSYSPSPPREYGRRYVSPSPRRRYSREKEPSGPTSLLVRNHHHDCRPEDLRYPFERFGPIKDIYLPRDYYTGSRSNGRRRSSASYSRSPGYARSYSRSPCDYSPRGYLRSVSPRDRSYRERSYRDRSYSRSHYASRSRSRSPYDSRSRTYSRDVTPGYSR